MPTTMTAEEEELRRLLEEQEAQGADVPTEFQTTSATTSTTDPAPVSQPAPTAAPVAMPPGTTPMEAPPPPPPPPTPSFDDLNAALPGFALQGMQEPNRFLSPFVQSVRESGDARIARQERDATAGIEEWASGRGLVGSSYEGDQMLDLKERSRLAKSEEERQLLEMLATTEAMDRAAAGSMGLSVGRFGFEQGLSGQQLELEREKLAQEERFHESALGQRESEFARSLGLDEKKFAAESDRFALQYGEQVAGRLQQDAQFTKALESEDARAAVDAGLRTRALDLQQEGMTMDEAYRQAALDQERELTESAQRLQEQGMNQENAYRYAALEQDATFRQQALDLQAQGMSLDEAYRQAELSFRQNQFAQEFARLQQQDLTEQERFDRMMEIYEEYQRWEREQEENRAANAAGG
jgi:hypothetical protein